MQDLFNFWSSERSFGIFGDNILGHVLLFGHHCELVEGVGCLIVTFRIVKIFSSFCHQIITGSLMGLF